MYINTIIEGVEIMGDRALKPLTGQVVMSAPFPFPAPGCIQVSEATWQLLKDEGVWIPTGVSAL